LSDEKQKSLMGEPFQAKTARIPRQYLGFANSCQAGKKNGPNGPFFVGDR
jgi:hypothetical protein